jgi:hypothetical protein
MKKNKNSQMQKRMVYNANKKNLKVTAANNRRSLYKKELLKSTLVK